MHVMMLVKKGPRAPDRNTPPGKTLSLCRIIELLGQAGAAAREQPAQLTALLLDLTRVLLGKLRARPLGAELPFNDASFVFRHSAALSK